MKSTLAASLIATALACSGTDDPAGPRCFEGTAGALGVTETVIVNIEEVDVGSGKVSFTGAGAEGFTCSSKSYTHSGLDLELEDVSDCMPDLVSIKKLQYCSDTDEVDVSVKVSIVPLAIKASLTRVACDGENFESCKGSEDPVVTEPTCYQGRGGALGLTETVTVILNDFADGAGSLDFSGDGIIGFSCSGKKLTKSGQAISLEDSSDCLPSGVEVSSVKYCSDSDTIKVTVKDTAVPIPISALLSKVACSVDELPPVEVAATGACTSDEQAALADPQEVGDKANTCGTSSYNIITGNFNHDKFNDCFSSSIGISKTCAECYAATGEYGAKNCKADCLLGWCKSGCLSCTTPAQETLATCTGFAAGTADPCEEEVKVEEVATGACTSDEQAALADPQQVGDKANTCGTSSYNIITGNFNHDKFNDCFSSSIGISKTCAECYAATGEYGAKNCKADCLLGWCKSGCLSCTAPAQETLATCTGFASGTADPCEEVKAGQGFLANVLHLV